MNVTGVFGQDYAAQTTGKRMTCSIFIKSIIIQKAPSVTLQG